MKRLVQLSSPVVIDSVSYTHGTLLASKSGVSVVSGTVHSHASAGEGLIDIYCERGLQKSIFTTIPMGLEPRTIEYESSCGGNVCMPDESMRVYQRNNTDATAKAGDLRAERCWAGDGFCVDRGSSGKYLLEVVEAEAHAQEPSAVAYWSDDPLPTVQYATADINDVRIQTAVTGTDLESYIPGTTIYFEPDASALPTGYVSRISVEDSSDPGTWVDLSSEHADSPLPADWAPSGDVYYYDRLTHNIRLGSGVEDTGNNIRLQYMLSGANAIGPGLANDVENYPADAGWLLDHSGAPAVRDNAGDSYVASCIDLVDDWDLEFDIYGGAGVVQFRSSTDPQAAGFWAQVDDSGNFSLYRRNANDADWVELTLLAPKPATYPLTEVPWGIRLEKTAATNEWTFSIRDDEANSWVEQWTGTLGSADITAGFVAFSDFGSAGISPVVNRSSIPSLVKRSVGYPDTAGEQLARRTVSRTGVAFSRTYSRGSAEPINLISNTTANTAMTDSATPARDHYDVDGSGDIVVYSEGQHDDILFIYDPDESSHGVGVGPAPRQVGNQPGNFAEFDVAPTATTVVANNRANWRDRIRIRADDYTPDVGEEFTILRGAGAFQSISSVTLGGVEIPSSHWHARPYQGVLLVSGEWMTGRDPDQDLVVSGTYYAWQQDAEIINATTRLLDIIDSGDEYGSLVPRTGSSYAYTISGSMELGASEYACTASGWVVSDYALGNYGATIVAGNINGQITPYWGNDGQFYVSTVQYDNTDDTATTTCNGDTRNIHDRTIENYAIYTINIGSNLGPSVAPGGFTIDPGDFSVGSFYTGTNPTACASSAAGTSIPFDAAGLLARLPDGSEILEAKLEVRADGLQTLDWETLFNSTTNNRTLQITHNGVMWRDFREVDGVVVSNVNNTPPAIGSSGTITFSLVGRRRDSREAMTYDGNPLDVPNDQFVSLGASVSVEATAGKWAVGDAKSLVEALVAARNAEVSDIMLWQSSIPLSSSANALAEFAKTLNPTWSASATSVDDGFGGTYTGFELSMAGKFRSYSALALGQLFVRYRLPEGFNEQFLMPVVYPKAI